MPKRDLYLLAYDMTDDRRRTKALEIVRAFGVDAQFSVHECLFTPGERGAIWRRLMALADPQEDRLLLMRLDPRLETLILGRPPTDVPAGGLFYAG